MLLGRENGAVSSGIGPAVKVGRSRQGPTCFLALKACLRPPNATGAAKFLDILRGPGRLFCSELEVRCPT